MCDDSRSQNQKEARAATAALLADPPRLRRAVREYGAHISRLSDAVNLQWDRIASEDFPTAQLDMLSATGLFRDLVDAGIGLRKLGLATEPALQRFNRTWDGSKDARDVLEHKADYIRDVGHIQLAERRAARTAGAATPDTSFEQDFVRDATLGTAVSMSVGSRDVSSQIGAALPAATKLAAELLDVIWKWQDANPGPEDR